MSKPELPAWVICYSDGSTFSSLEGDWTDAPSWDCQAVVFLDPVDGYAVRHTGDFFLLADDGTPIGTDLVGMFDYVVNKLELVQVKQTRSKQSWSRLFLTPFGTTIGNDVLSLVFYVADSLGVVKVGRMLSRLHWQKMYADALRLRDELRSVV